MGSLTAAAKRAAKKKAKKEAEQLKKKLKKKAKKEAAKAAKKLQKKVKQKTGFGGSYKRTKLNWDHLEKENEYSSFSYRHDSWMTSEDEYTNGWEVDEFAYNDDDIVVEVPDLDPHLDPDFSTID